jgi:hypothetical protein
MKLLVEISLTQSPNLQALIYLLESGQFELADRFEARYSPFKDQPNKSLKQELQELGILLNNPESYSEAVLSTKNLEKHKTIFAFDEAFIAEYRNKFKNKKSGATGDKSAIITKFENFFKEYPQYANKELILNATDKYINTERKQGFQFLMRADYFIYKQRPDKGGNSSTLAIFCEELEDNVGASEDINATLPKFT